MTSNHSLGQKDPAVLPSGLPERMQGAVLRKRERSFFMHNYFLLCQLATYQCIQQGWTSTESAPRLETQGCHEIQRHTAKGAPGSCSIYSCYSPGFLCWNAGIVISKAFHFGVIPSCWHVAVSLTSPALQPAVSLFTASSGEGEEMPVASAEHCGICVISLRFFCLWVSVLQDMCPGCLSAGVTLRKGAHTGICPTSC